MLIQVRHDIIIFFGLKSIRIILGIYEKKSELNIFMLELNECVMQDLYKVKRLWDRSIAQVFTCYVLWGVIRADLIAVHFNGSFNLSMSMLYCYIAQ